MRKYLFFVLALLVVSAGMAQEKKETAPEKPAAHNDSAWARNPYRLDYTIKELDEGKVVNTRTYSLVLQSAEERGPSFGEVKTGTRVPISAGTKEGDSSIQYIDVGINISARLHVMADNSGLLLTGNVEISTLATGPGSTGATGAPIIRQIRSNTTGEIVAGKANLIAALDDPISRHRFQIEVTPIKLR